MDEQILRRIAGGEHEALGELAERYETALLGLACGLLGGSRSQAEDAVQDAWIRVLRGAGGFAGRSSVKTWLFRIVINRCREIRRRDRRAIMREIESFRLHDAGMNVPANGTFEQTDRDRRLHDALRTLPAEQLEAVLLCHHHGVTQAEAAAVLDIPEGTLKGRVRTGLARLRKRLGHAQADLDESKKGRTP